MKEKFNIKTCFAIHLDKISLLLLDLQEEVPIVQLPLKASINYAVLDYQKKNYARLVLLLVQMFLFVLKKELYFVKELGRYLLLYPLCLKYGLYLLNLAYL